MKILRETDAQQHKDLIDSMKSLENALFEPQLGIFWYNKLKKQLFGVNKVDCSSIDYDHNHRRTYPKLHKDVWNKERQKAQFRKKPTIFQGDYTKIPRGRIFQYEDGHFEVMVGSWINSCPEVKPLIIDEFDLPEDVEFVQDRHWDIGHGWSEEAL